MVSASHKAGMVGNLWSGLPASASILDYETMQYQNT
jgi:hypothetical protein